MTKKEKWWKWHKDNPHIWDLFKRFTFEAIQAGHKHYSAWAVINRIRWHTDVETRGSSFKISNDFIAYYARYFHYSFPTHKGFFRTKVMNEEKEVKDEG